MGSRKVVIHYYLHCGASDNKTRYDKTRIKNLSRGNDAPRRNINCQAMEGYIMTDIKETVTAKLSTEVEKAFQDWTASHVKTTLGAMKRVDIFRAAGWKSTMCISPKSKGSTATDESWAFAKNAINSGFPKEAQKLMAMKPIVAGDKQVNGQNRSFWMRQANAIIADIKDQLANREKIAAAIEEGKAGKDATTRTPEMMVRDALEDCVKRIQKAETFEFDHQKFTLDEFIAYLNMFIKSIG